MKRFLVFTLTLLFATTCLFLTDLYALDQNFRSVTEFAGNVYGSTYVCTWFDTLTETAHSSHSVAVDNYGIGIDLSTTASTRIRLGHPMDIPSSLRVPETEGGKCSS